MSAVTPDDLRLALAIWLRFAPQWARAAFAAKRPHEGDAAAEAIAAVLAERMARSGWTIKRPAPRADTADIGKRAHQPEMRRTE